MVMSLIMKKAELSSTPDGNERRGGGSSISNSAASVTAVRRER
jgi:hypothetical protein